MSSWSLGHLNRTFFLRSKWKGLIFFLNVFFEFHAYVQYLVFPEHIPLLPSWVFFFNNSLDAYGYGARHWSMNHLQGATHLKKIGTPHPKATVYHLVVGLWSPPSRVTFFLFFTFLICIVKDICLSQLPTYVVTETPFTKVTVVTALTLLL